MVLNEVPSDNIETRSNSPSRQKRIRRAIPLLLIIKAIAGTTLVTDTALSIATVATNGAVYYPSIEKNEKKIKELLAKINAITPQIHEVETNIANATMQFELDLYNYKYWVVTVTKVLENIERSRKNESTEWVHQMEQRITKRVNSRFWQVYKLLAKLF